MKLYWMRYQLDGKVIGNAKIPAELTVLPNDVIIDNTWYMVADKHIEADEPTVVQCELVEIMPER